MKNTSLRLSVLLMLALTLLLHGCGDELVLTKATSQRWHGGAAGSGGGVNYDISFEKPAKATVEIKEVYVGNMNKGQFPRFVLRETGSQAVINGVTVKGEYSEFRVVFSENFPRQYVGKGGNEEDNPQDDLYKPAPSYLPAGFETGVLISYEVNGTPGVIQVSEFEELEALYYP